MRVYLAGPMSGYPDDNFPAFAAATATLRAQGFDVVSPAEIDQGPAPTWVSCMRRDIPALLTCDAVAVLPGWDRSRGASMEVRTARDLDMPVLDAATLEPVTSAPIAGALDRVSAEVVGWSRETFPDATPRAKAAHLLKEAEELLAAPEDPEEIADVFILLVSLAALLGLDLERAVRDKLGILRTRTWGEPDADGVRQHVREPAAREVAA